MCILHRADIELRKFFSVSLALVYRAAFQLLSPVCCASIQMVPLERRAAVARVEDPPGAVVHSRDGAMCLRALLQRSYELLLAFPPRATSIQQRVISISTQTYLCVRRGKDGLCTQLPDECIYMCISCSPARDQASPLKTLLASEMPSSHVMPRRLASVCAVQIELVAFAVYLRFCTETGVAFFVGAQYGRGSTVTREWVSWWKVSFLGVLYLDSPALHGYGTLVRGWHDWEISRFLSCGGYDGCTC